MKKTVLAIFLLLTMSGCKTRYQTIVEHRVDSIYLTKERWDSIHVHDSIRIREHGDTVWMEKWQTVYRDRLRVDTVYRQRVDTVVVQAMPKPTEKVRQPLTWWQRTRIHVGGITIWAAVISAAVWLIKKKLGIK